MPTTTRKVTVMLIKIGLAVLLASAQWAELAAARMAEEAKPMLEGAADRIHWLGVNTEAWAITALDAIGDRASALIWDRRP